jgi:hypothetical protein
VDWSEFWKNAPATFSIIKDFVVSGVAISGAVVGWKALSKWREETVGKRRLELAEDVLSAFYQIQEAIQDARTPLVLAEEMVKEEGVPDEVAGNPAYAPIRRLRDAFEHIRDLRTKRHRFAAVFGRDATKPWDEVEAILNRMRAASDALLRLRDEHTTASDPDAEFYREQRHILFRGLGDDLITPRLTAAVEQIEAICRPVITTWGRV